MHNGFLFRKQRKKSSSRIRKNFLSDCVARLHNGRISNRRWYWMMSSAISFFHQWRRKLDQYWQQKPNIAAIWNVGNSCRTRLLLLVGWRRCWHWFGYESELRIMACFRDPGKPTTIFVTGLYVGSISNRSQGVAEQQRKKNDQQRVLKFMTDHQPHVVCVGASNYNCRQLKDDIYEVFFCLIYWCVNT